MLDQTMGLRIGDWVYTFGESSGTGVTFKEKLPRKQFIEPARSLILGNEDWSNDLWPRVPEIQVFFPTKGLGVFRDLDRLFLVRLGRLLFYLQRRNSLGAAKAIMVGLESLKTQYTLIKSLLRPQAVPAALSYFWGWAGIDSPNLENEFHRFLAPALPKKSDSQKTALEGLWHSGSLVASVVGNRFAPWEGQILDPIWKKLGSSGDSNHWNYFLSHHRPFIQNEPDNQRDGDAMGVYVQNQQGRAIRLGYLRRKMAGLLKATFPTRRDFPAGWESISRNQDGEWDFSLRIADPCPGF